MPQHAGQRDKRHPAITTPLNKAADRGATKSANLIFSESYAADESTTTLILK